MNDAQKREVDLDSLLRGESITRLHIDDRIALEVVGGGNSIGSSTFEIGPSRSILEHLNHEPATAGELEAAIAVIEDELMPVIRLLPAHRCLVTSAPAVRDIAKLAGLDDSLNIHLDIATIELLFNRLVDVAYGTPAAQLGIPENKAFAANLLVLRELLHHGGFESVTVV